MLTLFNTTAAMILALAWLCIALTFPILAVWFGVRVARDLRRIADAASPSQASNVRRADNQADQHGSDIARTRGHVQWSAFGR